jgi:hypothetical protein
MTELLVWQILGGVLGLGGGVLLVTFYYRARDGCWWWQ